MVTDHLNVNSVRNNLTLLLKFIVFVLEVLGKAELLADYDGLSTRVLALGSSKSFLSVLNIVVSSSNRHEDGTNVNSSSFADGLTEGASHTSLESIGSSAGKHLVDSENVPRVNSHSHVESVLTSFVCHVLVSSNTSGFHSF